MTQSANNPDFSFDSKKKIVEATRRVLRLPRDGTNYNCVAFPRHLRLCFWASVTQPDATLNQFAFAEQEPEGNGGWNTIDSGFSGDGTNVYAVNAAGNWLPPDPVLIMLGSTATDLPKDSFTFNAAPPVIVPVSLSQDGGGDGSGTSPCSYTYSATYGSITVNEVSPSWQRPNGATVAATQGIASYSAFDGSITLLWCDEIPNAMQCSMGGS